VYCLHSIKYHIPYETIIIITYENICLVSCSHPNLINIHLGISFPLNLHQEYLMTRYCIQCHLFYGSKMPKRTKPVVYSTKTLKHEETSKILTLASAYKSANLQTLLNSYFWPFGKCSTLRISNLLTFSRELLTANSYINLILYYTD